MTVEESDELLRFVQAGKGAFRRLKRAQILLASEAGSLDKAIAINLSVGTSTVYRTKRRFVEEGLEAALSELPRPGADRLLEEKEEALLIATACSSPPNGRARWTLALLADEMVRLTKRCSISSETIRRRLAENQLKRWLKKMWCISAVGADFIVRMEDVLDLYAEKPDARFPVVCFDETPRPLIGTRAPSAFVWFSTTSRPTRRQLSTKPSNPKRLAASFGASNSITRRSTPAGSTWSRYRREGPAETRPGISLGSPSSRQSGRSVIPVTSTVRRY